MYASSTPKALENFALYHVYGYYSRWTLNVSPVRLARNQFPVEQQILNKWQFLSKAVIRNPMRRLPLHQPLALEIPSAAEQTPEYTNIGKSPEGPRTPYDPVFKLSGPKYHSEYGFWNRKPQRLGTWTL